MRTPNIKLRAECISLKPKFPPAPYQIAMRFEKFQLEFGQWKSQKLMTKNQTQWIDR